MNTNKLLGVMKENGDTQSDLAEYLGISRGTLNMKLHESNGRSFTQPEIAKIKQRYNLSGDEIEKIFFN